MTDIVQLPLIMKNNKNNSIQLLVVFILAIATILIVSRTVHTNEVIASNNFLPVGQTPKNETAIVRFTEDLSTNCRYGVSSWSNNDHNFIQELGVGWALNFGVNFNQNYPDGVEYIPVIRFKPELDESGKRTDDYLVVTPPFTNEPGGLGPIIEANPGRLWLVGNEVDRGIVQDDLMPEVYASAYHDAYHFIKQKDPSAKVAISGLVQVTPGRLQYLDIVWNKYHEKYGTDMPVDVWNMHIYILPERRQDGHWAGAGVALGTDPNIAIWESGANAAFCSRDDVYCYAEHDDMEIFEQQVVAMRTWMKNHGEQNKPLILSEFSLLYDYDQEGDTNPNTCFLMDEYGKCFTEERVSKFMVDSFAYLETASDTNLGYPVDNHKLVQQWLWFSVYYKDNFASNLVEQNYTVRNPGETFKTEVNSKRPFVANPFISQVSFPTASTTIPTGTTSITLTATVYNNGDTETVTTIPINFYADEEKTELIGTSSIPAGLAGCASDANQVQVVWNDLTTGLHLYWAEVEGGTTTTGFVLINPQQIFLPSVIRK